MVDNVFFGHGGRGFGRQSDFAMRLGGLGVAALGGEWSDIELEAVASRL
jgi:hypothetical protein